MSDAATFGTQLIGKTEKALNSILERQLAGTGLTEPQWVTLTIAVMSGGRIDHDPFLSRIASALKISHAEACARIDELAAAKVLQVPDNDGSSIKVTDAGGQLHGRITTAVTEITERLWGDLPAEDLRTAGRVLATVLDRASELAGA